MEQKPLYRKNNKTTHNGHPHLDFYYGKYNGTRYKYERHTKKAKFEEENEISFKGNHYKSMEDEYRYDYTPLFKFLLKCTGKKWSDVWKECQQRLNTTEPVLYQVINIKKNGLPYFYDMTDVYPQHRAGEDTYYSTQYVDENGILQLVNKDYIKEHADYPDTEWGESFNGKNWDNKTKSYRKY